MIGETLQEARATKPDDCASADGNGKWSQGHGGEHFINGIPSLLGRGTKARSQFHYRFLGVLGPRST